MPRTVKPKSLVTEGEIEAKSVADHEADGWKCWKQNGLGHAGRPDRLLWRGFHTTCFIEYKRPNEFPTPLQQEELDALEKAGHWVAACDSVASAKHFTSSIMYHDIWHSQSWRVRWEIEHRKVKYVHDMTAAERKKLKKGGRRGR